MRIYLDDHLSVIVGEMELIERCYNSNRHSELGFFLKQLQSDLRVQKETVEKVFHCLDFETSIQGQLKQGAAWLAEKIGRFKLNDSLLEYSDLSRVVELVALLAVTQERIALWVTLNSLSNTDLRFKDFEFSLILSQSELQLEELKTYHCSAIKKAFASNR
ncbi:hypothetical protein [Rubinisphaera sp.]|uniref:hypothetical protein n=1 Tax=Rubinisphaera sp. TaxID=2024857 RepID=UPI000C11D715|nr:hypothetical protein [Rubinisphaera sp.]MBV09106.1 hypothetical protein [Rubinisphaera sp.]|tara:strand:- start:1949 stop:2431 length:483 start_codon:yes stop_codon:yes gene_type:complete